MDGPRRPPGRLRARWRASNPCPRPGWNWWPLPPATTSAPWARWRWPRCRRSCARSAACRWRAASSAWARRRRPAPPTLSNMQHSRRNRRPPWSRSTSNRAPSCCLAPPAAARPRSTCAPPAARAGARAGRAGAGAGARDQPHAATGSALCRPLWRQAPLRGLAAQRLTPPQRLAAGWPRTAGARASCWARGWRCWPPCPACG
jgi:hypothetical protein